MDEHMKKYQVIIVGAGPAGLCTALSLHQNNIKDICIIEINNETFHKPCAGFLTSKSRDNLQLLGVDVEKDLNYQRVNSFDLFNNKEGYRIESLIRDCCMNMCLSDKVFEQLIEKALLFYNKNHKNKLKNTGEFICLC